MINIYDDDDNIEDEIDMIYEHKYGGACNNL